MTRTTPPESNDIQNMLANILTMLDSNRVESQRAQSAQARQANNDARYYPFEAKRQRLLSVLALCEYKLFNPNPAYLSYHYETLHLRLEYFLPQLQTCEYPLAPLRTTQVALDFDNQALQIRLL